MRTLFPAYVGLAALVLLGCGGGGGSNRASPAADPIIGPSATVVDTFAYDASGTYAGALRRCTYAGDATERCTLSELPFLGQEFADPTLDEVMQRVLVSHTWMGDNFRAVMNLLPDDMRLLLRSVTAIVIASDIRPAFYDPATGAIYLDADFLWLTPGEEAEVTQEPDPRSNFGADLMVRLPWRYVRDNERLTIFINPDGSRDLDQIEVINGFLMYHELAHAVDAMHPDRMPGLDSSRTARSYLTEPGANLTSTVIGDRPLASSLLEDLAEVSFFGEASTQAQRDLLSVDLVGEFANDGAVQYYAYSTPFEDFATLFETVMMSYHFGYDKDTGITDNPASDDSDDGIVAWGQRGRMVDQAVLARTLAVLRAAYPGDLSAVEDYVNSRPAPSQLSEGSRWGDTIAAQPVVQSAASRALRRGGREDAFLERRSIR